MRAVSRSGSGGVGTEGEVKDGAAGDAEEGGLEVATLWSAACCLPLWASAVLRYYSS